MSQSDTANHALDGVTFNHRRISVAHGLLDAVGALTPRDQERVFREEVDRWGELLRPHLEFWDARS